MNLNKIMTYINMELSNHNLNNIITPSINVGKDNQIQIVLNYHIQSRNYLDNGDDFGSDELNETIIKSAIKKQIYQMVSNIEKIPHESKLNSELVFYPMDYFDDFHLDIKCSKLVPKGEILINYEDQCEIANFITQRSGSIELLGKIEHKFVE